MRRENTGAAGWKRAGVFAGMAVLAAVLSGCGNGAEADFSLAGACLDRGTDLPCGACPDRSTDLPGRGCPDRMNPGGGRRKLAAGRDKDRGSSEGVWRSPGNVWNRDS